MYPAVVVRPRLYLWTHIFLHNSKWRWQDLQNNQVVYHQGKILRQFHMLNMRIRSVSLKWWREHTIHTDIHLQNRVKLWSPSPKGGRHKNAVRGASLNPRCSSTKIVQAHRRLSESNCDISSCVSYTVLRLPWTLSFEVLWGLGKGSPWV